MIREAGGIFALVSGPMECCDDEATREEEEFCELDATAGRVKGPCKLTGKTSELSTIGVVAEDEATVGLVTALVEYVLTMGRCRTMGVSQATTAISSRLAQTRPWRSLPTTQF